MNELTSEIIKVNQANRLQRGQIDLYKLRTNTLRDALAEAQDALEHALLSIVVEEVKRNTSLAMHKTQRTLDDDARRYSALDNS